MMLVLAGINSTFLIVAVLVLGFCINHIDNTGMLQPWLSRAYAASGALLLLHHGGGWGCTRSWEGTHPSWIKRYSRLCDMMFGDKTYEKKKGMFGVMKFVFPSHYSMWWSHALLGMAEHLPKFGTQWMNSLFCFVCVHSFSYTHELSHHYSSNFFPHPTETLSE